jgi:hypothetical protein
LERNIRWCTRCFVPVRELTPRPALHDRDFVGTPIHERGNVPRWSRWEKTATTFGPRGRIVATSLLFLTLVPALSTNALVYLVTFPFVAVVMLREIWAKGWFVPDDPAEGPRAPSEPEPGLEPEPISARKVLRWAIAVGAVVAFACGPIEVKASVIGFAAIALLVWFWTAFDSGEAQASSASPP